MAQAARRAYARPESEYDRQYRVLQGKRREKRIFKLRAGVFLAVSIMILVASISYYLTLQSDITNSIKHIASQEKQLNTLRLDNDENYSRITGNIDLEEVRRVAIQELGMRYADEGQIVFYDGEGSDYVRQVGVMPD